MSMKKPRLKQARRLGRDPGLISGIRDIGSKCKFNTRPGVHGAKRIRVSDYGKSLKEKQYFCISYGLRNKQLYSLHIAAIKLMRNLRKQGKEPDYRLRIMLESRLDRVVHRMGWAVTLAEARRQLVSHGAILVNGKKLNKPGYQTKPGDIIAIKEKSQKQDRIHTSLKAYNENNTGAAIDWVTKGEDQMSGIFVRFPTQDELSKIMPDFQEDQVIQFYSK